LPKVRIPFLNQLDIFFPSPPALTPLKAPHQSSTRAVIHTTHKEYPLSNQDRIPSLKPIHQDHSIITYKTKDQAKNKKTFF
jgi:hypothetical protein